MSQSNKISELQNSYILNNSNNYKKTLNYQWKEIIDKYLEVIMEYIKSIFENTKIKKTNVSKYIVIRGLDTITHVFRFLFLYTKNLNMTFYNTQRAYYYYIEFIDQISEEEISFLKLNTNDAILYVYKKTIYQINEQYRKNISELKKEEQTIFNVLNEYICMFKSIIIEFIYENNYDYNIQNENKLKEKIQYFYTKSLSENENDIKKHIQWLKEKKWENLQL
jgi:hypothetical protein